MSEKFFELFQNDKVLIEKIDSLGFGSQVYVQDHDEWVYLLRGKAHLMLNNEEIILNEGDYLFIEENVSHQVIKTSVDCEWLAVHIK